VVQQCDRALGVPPSLSARLGSAPASSSTSACSRWSPCAASTSALLKHVRSSSGVAGSEASTTRTPMAVGDPASVRCCAHSSGVSPAYPDTGSNVPHAAGGSARHTTEAFRCSGEYTEAFGSAPAARSARSVWSENGVSLAQKMRVGPWIPVGIQL
jgi:hypothetical protein